jgi:hypothetical protein
MTKLNLIMRKILTKIRQEGGLEFGPPSGTRSGRSSLSAGTNLMGRFAAGLLLVAAMFFIQNAQAQTNCSCNDFNITLDASGGAIVTPAMVVSNESDPGCDIGALSVRLLDENDNRLRDADGVLLPRPDSIRCNHVGEIVKAEVITSTNQVVCWAYANAEDKTGPSCSVGDITLECDEYRDPRIVRVMEDEVTNMTLAPGANGNFAVIPAGSGYGRVVDVDVYVDADVDDISDLRLQLAHPGGVMMFTDLTNQDSNCNGSSDIDATFDDEASVYNCAGGINGVVGPQGDLSRFEGTDKDGAWRIRYQNYGSSTFTFNTIRVIVYYDHLPLVEDNCNEVPTYSYVEDDFFPNCPDMGSITRTYTVTDPGGMTCVTTQIVTIELNTPPRIIWPRDTQFNCVLDREELDPIDLEQYDRPNAGVYYSGPFFEGAQDYCGNYAKTYNDEIYDICLPYGYKIRREWKVRDWCDPDFDTTHVQYIKVLDLEAPVITSPDTVFYTVQHNDCDLDVDLPEVGLADNCDVDPQTTVDLIDPNTRQIISSRNVLPGVYDAIYTARDACGNESWDTLVVVIEDLIEPVPICDRNTNVTLTNRGGTEEAWADVCASTINDGSYDNCELTQVLISKSGNDGTFSECLTYTCEDVGENYVYLRVWDASGNYNTCWAFINVEDKVQPELECEADTIYCTDDIDNELQEIVDITEQEWEDKGLIRDNCDSTVLICTDFVFEGDDCNPVYSRTCFVEDQYGNQSLPCEHRVFVQDTTPVEIISFPADVLDLPCNSATDPSRTGEPVVEYDCEHIGIRFQDEEFFLCNNSPNIVKIRRTWTITDWCTGEDTSYVQEIAQNDDVAPTLTIPDDFNADINTNDCEVTVPVAVSAVDDCGLPVQITNDMDNQLVSGAGNMVFTLPKGVHTIVFSATDACSNVTEETLTITVDDIKPPTARCSDITVNLKTTGIATVAAELIDNGSDDNCTDQANLIFMIQRNDSIGNPVGTPATEVVFDCNDIDEAQSVRLIVEDDSGNSTFCNTTVTIMDNDSICPPSSRFATVAGLISTSAGEPISNAMVHTDMPGIPDIMTNVNGEFMFPSLEKGYNYMMTVDKDDDYREGLSTIDLVYIKRHILQIEKFDDPLEYIAADANNSESVTTFDIAQLRRIILRLDDELSSNSAWRFIDKSHVFTDVDNPWNNPIPEYVMSENLQQDKMNVEFLGVKIGDVDQSYSLDGQQTREVAGKLSFDVANRVVRAGEEVEIVLESGQLSDLLGAQFTMEFDAGSMRFQGYSSEVLSESNLGMSYLDQGKITLSWDNSESARVEQGLITMSFVAQSDVELKEVIELSSSLTKAEAYGLAGSRYDIELRFIEDGSIAAFELLQNKPNPFTNQTIIGFVLPNADEVSLTITDMSGKQVYTAKQAFDTGYNEFTISSTNLQSGGVYYYQVETSSTVATKKMILFEN